MPPKSIQILLAELIDYAGLFPPAGLNMPQAVANYALYRDDPRAWMLARLIVPAVRLAEFKAAVEPRHQGDTAVLPWRISALVGADLATEIAAITAFNAHSRIACIDTIEIKAGSSAEIRAAKQVLPNHIITYVELPIAEDPRRLIDELAALGLRGKVRTGGVVPELFPPVEDLTRFLAACAAAGLPFKATAGLHHPIRAAYRLTYAPDSPQGTMYGYLNVFLATAFLQAGIELREAQELLQEGDRAAFKFGQAGVSWRGHQLTLSQLSQARQLAIAFGSCSFREPVDDLQALGLL